jgi:hypothetical protein
MGSWEERLNLLQKKEEVVTEAVMPAFLTSIGEGGPNIGLLYPELKFDKMLGFAPLTTIPLFRLYDGMKLHLKTNLDEHGFKKRYRMSANEMASLVDQGYLIPMLHIDQKIPKFYSKIIDACERKFGHIINPNRIWIALAKLGTSHQDMLEKANRIFDNFSLPKSLPESIQKHIIREGGIEHLREQTSSSIIKLACVLGYRDLCDKILGLNNPLAAWPLLSIFHNMIAPLVDSIGFVLNSSEKFVKESLKIISQWENRLGPDASTLLKILQVAYCSLGGRIDIYVPRTKSPQYLGELPENLEKDRKKVVASLKKIFDLMKDLRTASLTKALDEIKEVKPEITKLSLEMSKRVCQNVYEKPIKLGIELSIVAATEAAITSLRGVFDDLRTELTFAVSSAVAAHILSGRASDAIAGLLARTGITASKRKLLTTPTGFIWRR